MKVTRRREAMLQAVLGGMTDVATLCEHFGMSEATVRRDLRALARDNRVLRTYGGAAAVGSHEPEASLEERRISLREQKEAIAQEASTFVEDGDTVFLDGGTTTAALARLLAGRTAVHVVTNNLLVVSPLVSSGVQVTVIGGDVRPTSMSTLGPLAQIALSRLSVDKAFLGADGVVAELGLCEASSDQSYLKECVMRQAAHVFVLATADKLGRASQQHWAPLVRAWTLITDDAAQQEQLEPFDAQEQVTVRAVSVKAASAANWSSQVQ
ncbi:DeoR/GlpR family DNA-binding transcription regulator [Paraburkholderia rhynchosiae]|uniref:DeoR family transcriptional regulator n=1 Tax=Paraburkholderia rhynchosiae TaxID=487049 RepID=A0A2N7VLJ9_9BURK|nr:DeoR/GlpR family DNA-binding transcription regulator [Paraburkholderia rhynchosiae]PMS18051.1 DeoR family transcriptional regulator [Paraburkholderia rhynchosiae]CAB3744210.1 Glucitol operon repressor [Paraburkholderia rhynchosiae]